VLRRPGAAVAIPEVELRLKDRLVDLLEDLFGFVVRLEIGDQIQTGLPGSTRRGVEIQPLGPGEQMGGGVDPDGAAIDDGHGAACRSAGTLDRAIRCSKPRSWPGGGDRLKNRFRFSRDLHRHSHRIWLSQNIAMEKLTAEGLEVVNDLAQPPMAFSQDARGWHMTFAVLKGRGGMAQFNHPNSPAPANG